MCMPLVHFFNGLGLPGHDIHDGIIWFAWFSGWSMLILGVIGYYLWAKHRDAERRTSH